MSGNGFEAPPESSRELDAIREEIAAAMAQEGPGASAASPALNAADESERRWASWGCLFLGCAAVFGFWFFVRYAPTQIEGLETVEVESMEAFRPDSQPLPDELPSVPGVSPNAIEELRQVSYIESFDEALEQAALERRFILMIVGDGPALEVLKENLFGSTTVGVVCAPLIVLLQNRLPEALAYLEAPEAGGFELPRMLLLNTAGEPLSHWSASGMSPASFVSTVDEAIAEAEAEDGAGAGMPLGEVMGASGGAPGEP